MKLKRLYMQAGKRKFARLACLSALLLVACSQPVQTTVAQEPDADTACALDGMILKDYPGPKAQILYAEGKPDFFCDLMELFRVLLMPEQKRQISALYVQDMGKTDWAQPVGHWIDAKKAFYVVGSKKAGSMGPTFGTFGNEQDAHTFMQQEGGRILSFDQITPDMVALGASRHGSATTHGKTHEH